jgi:hypothetical protein
MGADTASDIRSLYLVEVRQLAQLHQMLYNLPSSSHQHQMRSTIPAAIQAGVDLVMVEQEPLLNRCHIHLPHLLATHLIRNLRPTPNSHPFFSIFN